MAKVDDVNDVVQAAIGYGQTVTRIYEGERWFDLVVRFAPSSQGHRVDPAISWSARRTARLPVKQLAFHHGADRRVHRVS